MESNIHRDHIIIVRSYGDIIDLNTYNCQEIGLAKALVKKGLKVTFLIPEKDNRHLTIRTEGGQIDIVHVEILWKLHARYCWYKNFENTLEELEPTFIQVHDMDLLMTWRTVKWAKHAGVPCFLIQGPYDKWKKIGFRQLNELYNRTFGRYIIKNVTRIGVKTELASEYLNNYQSCNTTPTIIGLDTDTFKNSINCDWRTKLNLKDKKILLYVGSIQPRRNPMFLIDVIKKLPDNYILMIAGHGIQINDVSQKIEKEGLNERCFLLGELEQKKLPSLYKSADCFLLASDYEILGMVIMESMFFGLPVISTKTTGADFIITNGVDGIILDNKDEKIWANNIQNLLSDESTINLYSQNGQSKINEMFVWDKTVNTFLNLYYA